MPRANHEIPKRYLRHFFAAIENEIGVHGLRMIFNTAEISIISSTNKRINAVEFGVFAWRDENGSARGALNRIGRSVWERMVVSKSWGRAMHLAMLLFPSAWFARIAFEILA